MPTLGSRCPPAKSGHIGIIACSAEGAALCYRTICLEGPRFLGPNAHPEVSMHTHSLSEYVECLRSNDWQGVGQLMLASAEKLANAGADFLICPDNTIHGAASYLAARSPLSLLHIVDAVAAEAISRNFRRLGLLGTRWLVESSIYPDKLTPAGLECVRPAEAEVMEIDRIIMDELVAGRSPDDSVAYHQYVIDQLKNRGCDAVILGCTEIPLIIDDTNSPLPVLDSTRLLARAALQRAVHSAPRDAPASVT